MDGRVSGACHGSDFPLLQYAGRRTERSVRAKDNGIKEGYAPLSFSSSSCSVLQKIHMLVTGRASSLLMFISSPHASQMPKVPLSILSIADSIFLRSLCSLPLRRSIKLLSISALA